MAGGGGREEGSGEDLQLAVATSGFSGGQILPRQLASNPAWSLACGYKCFSKGSQGLCDPSYGCAGSPACDEAGEEMLSSGPRQGWLHLSAQMLLWVAWDAIGHTIKEKGCE